MSEPVQANQPAPAGTDPQTTADEVVAAADAAVSAADLDAALAEVDKMQTTDGGDAVGLSTNETSSPSDNSPAVSLDQATPSAPDEPLPSQDQLDDIARQVEATVFGDGSTATDSVVSAQPVLASSMSDGATQAMAAEVAAPVQPSAAPPATEPRPVTPAPSLPSFLPAQPTTPVTDAVQPPPVSLPQNQPVGQTAAWQTAPQPAQPTPYQPNQPTYSNQPSFGQSGQYPTSQAFAPSGNPSLAQSPVGMMSPGQGGIPMQPIQPGQFGQVGFGQGQQFGGQSSPYGSPGGGANQGQLGYGTNQMGQPNQNQMGQSNQFAAPTMMQMPGQGQGQGWPNQQYGTSQGQPQQPTIQQPGFAGQATGFGQATGQLPPVAGQQQNYGVTPASPPALVPGTVISGPGSLATSASQSAPAPTPAPVQPPASVPSSVVTVVPTSSTAPASSPTNDASGKVPGSPAAPPPSGTGGGKSRDGKLYSSLVDVLADMAILTPDQLTQLKQDFLTTGRNYEDLLIEKKWLSEENLTKARAKLNNMPYITLAETGISPEALSKLDESVARRYGILPFAIDKTEHKLSVAMKNPLDIQAIAFAEQKTGYHLVVHYSSPTEVERMITERYAQNLSSEVDEALKDTEQSKVRHKKQDQQLNDFGGVIRDAPINRIVETILEFAVKSRASDIHIEPMPNKVRVRYRIDGILVEKLVLPRSVIDAVVSRIKILGNMKIDEKRIPQDGRFNYSNDDNNVDLRVSTIPTVNGEKVNMRLLEKNLNVPTMEQLGLDGLSLANVKEAIKVPHGIILISGPTGSGKTTTLYALLHILNTPKVNIVTLEDPVEYQMLGVNQVQINPKAGLTFATGLRAFLRQDPNIVMVGEMRDRETTELAIQASLTGHLVFSTIHTSSAATALPRMTDMGAENFLIASSVTMIIAQRVVRKINPEYREEYVPDPAVVADIAKVLGPHFDSWLMQHGKTPQTLTLFRPSPNRPENEPEYLGRIAIYEVLRMTEAIGRMVLQNRPASEIEQEALRNGMLLMKQDGYIKALNGITTIEEVLRVAEV